MECYMKVSRKCLFMKEKDKIKSSPANKIKYICVLIAYICVLICICICVLICICIYMCMYVKTYNLFMYYCVVRSYVYY